MSRLKRWICVVVVGVAVLTTGGCLWWDWDEDGGHHHREEWREDRHEERREEGHEQGDLPATLEPGAPDQAGVAIGAQPPAEGPAGESHPEALARELSAPQPPKEGGTPSSSMPSGPTPSGGTPPESVKPAQ